MHTMNLPKNVVQKPHIELKKTYKTYCNTGFHFIVLLLIILNNIYKNNSMICKSQCCGKPGCNPAIVDRLPRVSALQGGSVVVSLPWLSHNATPMVSQQGTDHYEQHISFRVLPWTHCMVSKWWKCSATPQLSTGSVWVWNSWPDNSRRVAQWCKFPVQNVRDSDVHRCAAS